MDLIYTGISEQDFGDPSLNARHAIVRETDNAWRAARASRAPEDRVRLLAEKYVRAAHDFQRARFGSIRVRISVAALLR